MGLTLDGEPWRELARLVRQHEAWQLLGIYYLKKRVSRNTQGSIATRIRTQAPLSPTSIGDMIFVKRKRLGLPQFEIAKLFNVRRSTLGNWEANHNTPQGKALERVKEWLDQPQAQVSRSPLL